MQAAHCSSHFIFSAVKRVGPGKPSHGVNTVFQEGGYTNSTRTHLRAHRCVQMPGALGQTGAWRGVFLNPGGVSTLCAGGAKSQGNAHPVWLRERGGSRRSRWAMGIVWGHRSPGRGAEVASVRRCRRDLSRPAPGRLQSLYGIDFKREPWKYQLQLGRMRQFRGIDGPRPGSQEPRFL